MDNTQGIEFHDANNRLLIDDGKAIIRRTQEIPSEFLDQISDARQASLNAPTGDLHYVGSIPAVIVEKWMAEGFNIFDPNNTLEDIFRRIRREDAERLIGTAKQVF